MTTPPTHFNFTTDVMERWARTHPENLALWCVDETGTREQRFTFAQLAEEFRKATALFHEAGIRPGDRVLVILPRGTLPLALDALARAPRWPAAPDG